MFRKFLLYSTIFSTLNLSTNEISQNTSPKNQIANYIKEHLKNNKYIYGTFVMLYFLARLKLKNIIIEILSNKNKEIEFYQSDLLNKEMSSSFQINIKEDELILLPHIYAIPLVFDNYNIPVVITNNNDQNPDLRIHSLSFTDKTKYTDFMKNFKYRDSKNIANTILSKKTYTKLDEYFINQNIKISDFSLTKNPIRIIISLAKFFYQKYQTSEN